MGSILSISAVVDGEIRGIWNRSSGEWTIGHQNWRRKIIFEVLPKIQGGDDGSGIEIRVIWIYDFKELRLGVDCPLECQY